MIARARSHTVGIKTAPMSRRAYYLRRGYLARARARALRAEIMARRCPPFLDLPSQIYGSLNATNLRARLFTTLFATATDFIIVRLVLTPINRVLTDWND